MNKKIKAYVEGVTRNPGKWSVGGPNCKTFANDAIKAGKEKDEEKTKK